MISLTAANVQVIITTCIDFAARCLSLKASNAISIGTIDMSTAKNMPKAEGTTLISGNAKKSVEKIENIIIKIDFAFIFSPILT